ncbi:hypothetical protein [Paraconexibacter algicola]|uniref:Uncharacterized protein n=1 Tax=Paraconexibacter algicola TaxID=2133960 RepID=A0A2T4ULB2_9ACTN|nr:hypothetical protein [Paraconexibacter algicola]PTL60027.1 hypothetical protein C7Y72_10405 [Paraconexibacter algicola]
MNAVLHAVRVKGIASEAAIVDATGLSLGEVERELATLEGDELVLRRPSRKRPGWVLTEEGRIHHGAQLAAAHDDAELAAIAEHYEGFLAVNAQVKTVSAKWQHATDDAARFELIDRIETLHGRAAPVLERAGAAAERYGRYGARLGAALEKLEDDQRFFVSPLVDSYHTVWFECHEDFLLTLGRTRAGEGSE